MSAANANAQTVRRPVPPARPATAPVARATAETQRAAPVHPGFDEDEHEFRLNLSDIPRLRESLVVDGLKPTLLSRLFDLIAPIKA
jgi:hypothetical protein